MPTSNPFGDVQAIDEHHHGADTGQIPGSAGIRKSSNNRQHKIDSFAHVCSRIAFVKGKQS